jgi:hypothetical protein
MSWLTISSLVCKHLSSLQVNNNGLPQEVVCWPFSVRGLYHSISSAVLFPLYHPQFSFSTKSPSMTYEILVVETPNIYVPLFYTHIQSPCFGCAQCDFMFCVCILGVSQEERSIFWEAIVSVILCIQKCALIPTVSGIALLHCTVPKLFIRKRHYVLFPTLVFIVQVTRLVQFTESNTFSKFLRQQLVWGHGRLLVCAVK